MVYAILFTVVALSVVLCHRIASSRRANPVFWGMMGALFGPIAIPFALFAKPRSGTAPPR